MSDPKALSALLAAVLSLSSGCGQAAAPDFSTAPKMAGFSPQPPEQNSTGGKDAVSDSYERAASRFAPYAAAAPGERSAILRDGLPLLGAALKASDERISGDAKAVNFRTVAKLDSRFAEAWVWKEFRTVANGSRKTEGGALRLNVTVTYQNVDGLPKASEPVASGDAAAEVAQLSAKTVARGIAEGAKVTKKAYDDLAFGNAVQSLLASAMGRKDNVELLKLKPGDSLETREQKVVVKATLDGFLGSVISYKGSFFLAAERASGLMEIWEFKNRVNVLISRESTDDKTRLNTGVELRTKVEFTHDLPTDLCRKYAGGYWGTWGEFPEVGKIEIEKDENWNVKFVSDLPFRSFHRLSSAEIDVALAKTTTTRAIAAAEKKVQEEQASPEVKLTLVNFYVAREQYEKAHELAAQILEFEDLELPVATRLATALLGEVAFNRPAIAETVQSGVGFKYPTVMKGFNPEIGEMQRLPYPRRLGKGHFYGEGFDLSDCIKAFERLNKADPTDADALFDLAILEVFGGERFKKPLETGNDAREKSAAEHLTEAVAAAAKEPPKSGRNFAKLVTEEPTFIVLEGQETFERLLGRLLGGDPRRAPLTYGKKFERQISYLNAGY